MRSRKQGTMQSMNFAEKNRAAMQQGSGAPLGYVFTPPNRGIVDPFIRNTTAAYLASMGMTCAQWSNLTQTAKLDSIYYQDRVVGGLIAISIVDATALAAAIDNHCLAHVSAPFVAYSPFVAKSTVFAPSVAVVASGSAGSGDVAAGFSFSLPELIVGGLLGALAMNLYMGGGK